MPFYFAYGSNMDRAAMRTRCPKARLIANAKLARHRFVLMGNGWASVWRDPRAEVHGVLYDLALSDVPPLDRYEDVAHGLYTKELQPVLRPGGFSSRALVYVGSDPTTGGTPPPGYMEAILEAAHVAGLPASYIAGLDSLVPRKSVAPAFVRSGSDA